MTAATTAPKIVFPFEFCFALRVIQSFVVDFHMEECERKTQETPVCIEVEQISRGLTFPCLCREQSLKTGILMSYFQALAVKRSPAVHTFTCSRVHVHLIKFIVFCY